MNTPNKLTLLRMLLIPIFVFFMIAPAIQSGFLWATLVFALASGTDFLDGYLARKHGLVTDFGKLMDPLADKLLVASALICLVEVGLVPVVVCILIIAREFLVTSVRMLAAQKGRVIAADGLGKVKTVFQMVWVIFSLLTLHLLSGGTPPELPYRTINFGLMLATAALTVISGLNYLVKNRDLLADR